MPNKFHIHRFISLKWKALFFTSLVLMAVTASFASFNYIEFRDLFLQRREDLQIQYALQVQGLLDLSSNRQQQLSATIASWLNKQSHFSKDRKHSIIEGVELLTSSLEVNMGIEIVALISDNGEILAANRSFSQSSLPGLVAEAVQQVIKSESPLSLIDCTTTCLQFTISPVLGAGGNIGALILGVSLADVVLDFRRVSGTDLGLIVENVSSAILDKDRFLPRWNATVVAFSNVQKNLHVLRLVTEKISSLSQFIEPAYVNSDGKELEVRVFPLHGFGKRQIAYLALVADIGDAVSKIHASTQQSILLGATGLVLSEFLLLFILWPPMSRLKRTANILPQLAEGKFSQSRLLISSMLRPSLTLRDEVDDLNDTALALSHQLEALNQEVEKHTADLSQRMEEITRERNFVTNVLDTAQAIILTQDSQHQILMINPYGQRLLGYSSEEMLGMCFENLLTKPRTRGEVSSYLDDLALGRREHFEMESDLTNKENATLNVVWQHSKLHGQSREGPVILSVGMDITARKKAELRLAWLADHDPLTGLFNRRRFEKELEEAIASAKRYHYSGALLFFDLDQFKYINDTSGHGAGDRLLVILSNSLPGLLREVDIIGRLGGDEFGIILSHANADEAISVAKKILAHINEMRFAVDDRVHKISASIGVALFPEHGSEVQDLLARTDLAMYQVKETGRGGWYLLSADDRSHRLMQERVLWKQRVENALMEKRFVLYVQPIVNLSTGVTSHWEVLLRMRGEDGKLIAPSQFIEVAENTGLINVLDRMVLSEAAAHLGVLREQGRNITLTINLSAHAFNDSELLDHIKLVLNANRLDPKQIIFEMTETAAIADLGPARSLMEAVNEIGCQFALDDFGTGFSSFYYLRQLPFDYIKIDGSFIRNLPSRPDDQVLVKSMADIALAFNKFTIAEQVEDAETLEYLKNLGINYAQGYYTGKPMDISEAFK